MRRRIHVIGAILGIVFDDEDSCIGRIAAVAHRIDELPYGDSRYWRPWPAAYMRQALFRCV